ncbi:MAG: hypothetical protein ABIQ99_00045, partial [Thermoflexales bacterium]
LVLTPIAVALGLAIGLTQWWDKGQVLQLGLIGLMAGCLVANALLVGETVAQLKDPRRFANHQLILESLQSFGLTYGYSDYWNSLNYTYLSNEALQIRALICDGGQLRAFNWWAQSQWYLPNPEHRPSFVLLTTGAEQAMLKPCKRETLLNQFGPARSLPIDNGSVRLAEVLIWDYDIAPRLAR